MNIAMCMQPFEGHLISLILPDMTKESFCAFMDYFKEQTVQLYGSGTKVLLITDGAGGGAPNSPCSGQQHHLEDIAGCLTGTQTPWSAFLRSYVKR